MKCRLLKTADSVCLEGVEYKINTDFKVWIEIEGLFFEQRTDSASALAEILALAYPVLPQNPYKAVQGIVWFYSGGRQDGQNTDKARHGRPCYDLTEDFDYIWGGFLGQYGIDLTQTDMHWWKFQSLLACLNDETRFSKIVAIRSMDTSAIGNKEQKRYYEKLKKQFRLKGEKSPAQDEAFVAECFAELF